MSQLYTNLPLSRKIASLGVECESEHYFGWIEAHQDYELDNGSEEGAPRAYLLGELPLVLQAIGAVKGWKEATSCRWCCNETVCVHLMRELWQSHFLEIARLYLDSKEKAFSYLDDLLN